MNPHFAHDAGARRPAQTTAAPTLGLSEQTWKHPASPGAPRKIHTPLGRKVKTEVAGNV